MAFSKKTSKACTDKFCNENDIFKSSKTAKTTNSTCTTCTIVPGLMELLFFQNQFAVDQKYKRKSSCRVVSYIFQNVEIRFASDFQWCCLTDKGSLSATQHAVSVEYLLFQSIKV